MTRAAAERMVGAMFPTIANALARDKAVTIAGFRSTQLALVCAG